jgi:hypothetical protein
MTMIKHVLHNCTLGAILVVLASDLAAQTNAVRPFLFRELGPSSRRTPVIISEVMYNTQEQGPTQTLEYVEIFNTDPAPFDLSGHRISGDIDYTFADGTFVDARSFLVISAAPTAFSNHYATTQAIGPWVGQLGNAGGTIRLRNRFDKILLEIDYEDEMPWPIEADGQGHSVVLRYPDYGEGEVRAWSASASRNGSPGTMDTIPADHLRNVKINEWLAHTDLPQTDFIELFNHGTQTVDLAGCVLRDSSTNRFTIPPATQLGPASFVSYDQATLGFSLSSRGDRILLVASNLSYVIDAVKFSAQENGVASGRLPDGAPKFHELASTSPGTPNAASALNTRDVVINEIMYHPLSGDSDDEYIELYNRSTQTVDLSFWRITDGVEYTIPNGTQLPPGAFLVVARNAKRLRARYNHLSGNNLLGNFSGKLADSKERVRLTKPDDPDLPHQDFVIVDEVTYDHGWGAWADGGGSSLELIDAASDNRRASNWRSSDESQKSEWTSIDYTDYVEDGDTTEFGRLFILSNQAGEFLIDDISMTRLSDGSELVANGSFSTELSPWTAQGNHYTSARIASGGFGDDGGVLHVRASGQGRVRSMATARQKQFDRVETPLLTSPTVSEKYTFKARVRWLAGWPHMRLSLGWYWMEALYEMAIPQDLGTPGLPNSRVVTNAPPAVWALQHTPILPVAGEDVIVHCRAHDSDGLSEITLESRDTALTPYQSVAMRDDGLAPDTVAGDGLYAATIPGLAANKLAGFRVRLVDGASPSNTTYYPSSDPFADALVHFASPQNSGLFARHHIWVSQQNETLWESWETRANGMADCTWVYNGWRAVYNSGVRWRGNGRVFNDIRNASYSLALSKAFPYLGDSEIKYDIPSRNGSDGTYLQEHHAFWIARESGLAAGQVRFLSVHVNNGDLKRQDLEVPTRGLINYWYDDTDPHAFEHRAEDPLVLRIRPVSGNTNLAYYRHGIEKKKTTVPDVDYRFMTRIGEAWEESDSDVRDRRLRTLIHPDGMGFGFAMNRVINHTDSYGLNNKHNISMYASPTRRARWHMVDLDGALAGTGQGNLYNSQRPGEILATPYFRRGYLRGLDAAASGPLRTNESHRVLADWYAALLESGWAPNAPTAIATYTAARKGKIETELNTLAAAFSITSNGGNDFSTTNRIIQLTGTAPFTITDFKIKGLRQDVTFPSFTTWKTPIGLSPGPNSFLVSGYTKDGQLASSSTITVTYTGAAVSAVDKVIISEIMYDPVERNGEYVEFFNRSFTDTFDLRGWRLNGVDISLSGGHTIGPREYRIVAEDEQVYALRHATSEFLVGEYAGGLDNGGETLSLLQPIGSNTWRVVDSVQYDDDAPWPNGASNQGRSLQLLDLDSDNNRVGNWAQSQAQSASNWVQRKITTQIGFNPFLIGFVRLDFFASAPGNVLIDDIQLVTGTVAAVGFNYIVNPGFETALAGPWLVEGNHAGSVIVSNDAMQGNRSLQLSSTGNGAVNTDSLNQTFSLVGLMGETMTLSYWYKETEGLDILNTVLQLSNIATGYTVAPVPLNTAEFASPGYSTPFATNLFTFPSLWINEVMPSNVSVIADNAAEFDPWIEIYNADTNAISLSGFSLGSGIDVTNLWSFPTGLVLVAHERLLVWADGETHQATPDHLHADFRLNSVSGLVVLAKSHGTTHVIIDYVRYDSMTADSSVGALPEGATGNPHVFQTPTPGTTNTLASAPATLYLNEWMSDNTVTLFDDSDNNFEDWFEIYNPGAQSVSLTGYTLTDDLQRPAQFTIPAGVTVPAKGFLLVWADGDEQVNALSVPLHVNFGLNRNGDTLALYRPDGHLVDQVLFGAQGSDQSDGRWPDGSHDIYTLTPATPGDTNLIFVISSLAESSPNTFKLDVLSQSGRVYHVESSPSLNPAVWSFVDIVTAETSVVQFEDTTSNTNKTRFYRITSP